LRSLLRDQLSRGNERQGLLVDTIRGAESIRANNAGWRFAQWREITASISATRYSARHQQCIYRHDQQSFDDRVVAAVVVGIWQIEAGLLTMGGLIACSILGGRIIAPVAQSVQYMERWQHVQPVAQLGHRFSLPPERRADQQLVLTDEPAAALTGRRFAYAGSPIRQLVVDALHLESRSSPAGGSGRLRQIRC
jgi:ATP-binding cassette subfamily C protein LapB